MSVEVRVCCQMSYINTNLLFPILRLLDSSVVGVFHSIQGIIQNALNLPLNLPQVGRGQVSGPAGEGHSGMVSWQVHCSTRFDRCIVYKDTTVK